MRVELIGIKGYNYINKEGQRKEGLILIVKSTGSLCDDDNEGNYTYGFITDNIFIPRNVSVDKEALIAALGQKIELVYERGLGDRYERLTEIKFLDE